jgi:hypothetical protein
LIQSFPLTSIHVLPNLSSYSSVSQSKIISSVKITDNGQNKFSKKFDDLLKTILEKNKILKEKVDTLEKKVTLLESNSSNSQSLKENDLDAEVLDR